MNKSLEKVVKKIDKLPELFHIAVKVSKMLDDPDVNAQELASVILLDQALTTQILKLCNSAHYGFSRKITSIHDAVVKLGFKTLKSLIFMAIAHGVLAQELEGYSLAKGDLWKNSISCAVYSKHLAGMVKYKDPELAFTAGLLRDIGKLMIHEYVGINYGDIVDIVNSQSISFSEAEKNILSFNHSQIGSEMANKWNFPPALVDVIKYHHIPELAIEDNCEDPQLISIVHVADSISMILGLGIGNDGMMYNFSLKALECINIMKESLSIEELISEMVDLSPVIESMLGSLNAK